MPNSDCVSDYVFIAPKVRDVDHYSVVLSERGIFDATNFAERVAAGDIAPREIAFEIKRLVKAVADFRNDVIAQYVNSDGFVTIAEAAILLGMSQNSLYLMKERKNLPPGIFVKTKGKVTKVHLARLQECIAQPHKRKGAQK